MAAVNIAYSNRQIVMLMQALNLESNKHNQILYSVLFLD